MVAAAVSANNNRIETAETTTNWGNDGGGGGIAVETDIVYQNLGAASRKISTTLLGRSYTHGAGTDTTATDRRHMMAKITVTNPAALLARTSPALHLRIGSSSANFKDVYVAGNDNYPARGGWLLVPISMNVSGYWDATGGTIVQTSLLYWSIRSDFSAGSKAENVVIDAIDYGSGLHIVSGDGASAAGTFVDFVTFDQGTAANRYGYVFTQGSLVFVNGRLEIGTTGAGAATLTEFESIGEVVTWQNGYAETGFHRLKVDLSTANNLVDISGGAFLSEGEKDNTLGLGYTTTEDTRAILEVTGTATGTRFHLFGGHKVSNFSDVILNSRCELGDVDVQTESLTQGTAHIHDSVIRTTSVTSVATCSDPTFGASSGFHDVEFVQDGAGHAVELSAIGATVTLTNMTWTGYGADTTDSAAIDVTAASGTTTINWSGGTAPTYKTAGATVVLVNTVNVTLTGMKDNTEVRVFATGTTTELDGIEDATTGTTDDRSFTVSLAATTAVDIRLISVAYEIEKITNFVFPSSDASIPVQQRRDRNYVNP